MYDRDLEYFKKGCFTPINNEFVIEGKEVLTDLAQFQDKYQKNDMDTLLNELHDSIVGSLLGFSLINTNKHGFDCKYSEKDDIFLESKVASFYAKTWNATFNDTTYEKTDAFCDKKVWLALSIWKNACDLICICYGQNEKIGEFLRGRVDVFKQGKVVRSTQSIAMTTLILEYGFDILAVDRSPRDLYNTLCLKNSSFRKMNPNKIHSLSSFNERNLQKLH